MKKLSKFDVSMLITFLVITLVGGGIAYYLDAYKLAAAQSDVQAADQDFEKYSSKMVYLPTEANLSMLRKNIDLVQSQLDPVVKNNLQAQGNKLKEISNENSVTWKHRLDDSVAKLNASAKLHGVQVPPGYYYSFSYFLGNTPSEEDTAVLSKQLQAIVEMVNILINAPVNSITIVRRTAEDTEDPGARNSPLLPGHAVEVAGGLYTAYPFEIEFDATTGALRKVINDLMQSPYLFIIRSVSAQNTQPTSPQIAHLDEIVAAAAQAQPQVQASLPATDSPGAAAESKPPAAGPQYLFGGETIRVRLRIDLIDWKGLASSTTSTNDKPAPAPASSAGNR